MSDLVDAMNGEHVYQDSVWFCGGRRGDWMGRIFKHDGKWCAVYRFRYYRDDKAFDSQDRKSWHALVGDNDSEETLDEIRKAFDRLKPLMELQYGMQVEVIEFQCFNDDPKFTAELAKRPWTHVRQATPAEVEQYKRTGRLP